jgi:hypothetical protein
MDTLAKIFDRLRELWRRPRVVRNVCLGLIYAFVFSLTIISLNKLDLLPYPLARMLPTNPFHAVMLAFGLVLLVEAVELIIAIADSVSLAVGKQLEIMGLLLLRETFTDISRLGAHIDPGNDVTTLLQIACTATAGLMLFIMRGLFVRFRIYQENKDIRRYINAKKSVSLMLFCFLVVAGVYDAYAVFVLDNSSTFFINFYTSLIFADILLVLGGQYYMPGFHAIFRNSGYAVGALLMRLSFGAPHYLGAAICVFAGLYILALTWAASCFSPEDFSRRGTPTKAPDKDFQI